MSKYKDLTPTNLAKCDKLAPNIIRCLTCNGSGLVPTDVENMNCGCIPCKFCMNCQNKYKYGNYDTCSKCYGLGVMTKERAKIINYNSIS
jgi:DnaJ-class molecular chaperone